MRLTRLIPFVLACGLAVVAAGCGEEQREDVTFRGTQAEVAGIVDDLEDAAENEEIGRICRALVAAPLRGPSCADRVQEAIDDSDQYALDVREVRVSGTSATARVITGAGDAERTTTMRFVREGGAWRISAFG